MSALEAADAMALDPRSDEPYDDPGRDDDLPPDECEHEFAHQDIIDGRWTCMTCGHSWWSE